MDNKKLLLKNFSYYSFGTILIQALTFLLLPLYSKYLSKADYGILSAMGLLSQFMYVFISLNVIKSIYRCYWDYESEYEKKVFLGTVIISVFALSTINTLSLYILNKYLTLIFKSIPFYPFYLLVLMTIYIKPYYEILTIYFRVKEQAKQFVILSTTMFIINITTIIYFVVIKRMGAEGPLLSAFLVNLLFLLIVIVILKDKIVLKFRFSILKNALAYSLPLIPNVIAGWIINLSDRIFIEKYFTLADVGIYSMGYKLAGASVLLTGGFFGAYNPMFLRVANSKNPEDEKNILYLLNKNFIIIMIIFCFLLYLFSENIVEIVLHQKFYESYKIFQLIVIGNLIVLFSSLVNPSLTQDKKMVTIMWIAVINATLNLLLNYLLIPQYGMYGAAYATMITFLSLSVMSYYFARKCSFFIPWAWKKILLYISLTVSAVIISSIIEILLIKIVLALAIVTIYILENRKFFIRQINSLRA